MKANTESIIGGKVFGERQIVRDVVEMLTEINDDVKHKKKQM